jgi:hypothetical protein
VPQAFEGLLQMLGEQPYFSLQPIVCNVRNTPPGGNGNGGIRGLRLETTNGETAAFRVFLSEKHVLWVVDGQHRRHAADMVMAYLEQLRQTGRYPGKGAVILTRKGDPIDEDEMTVWNEAYEAARSYATLTVEVHLGLNIEQERQLFHDLNRLGKKVDSSLAFQFDGSNPITLFIKKRLSGDLGLAISDSDAKDWSEDKGALALKDVVAVNAVAFLNKGNIVGATPAIIEPREDAVSELWARILDIPDFGAERSKEKTVAAQPVVLKALAKILYDLNFSNRKPENAHELFASFLNKIPDFDFRHSNPRWRYFELTEGARIDSGLRGLEEYLPSDSGGANRDIGSLQGEHFRFGAKHNDIYPLLADMIRWRMGLPSRREV